MAAAVRTVSTLRLVSGAAGLSGKPALVEGVGPLEAFGAWAGVDGCAAGALNATGCAKADGELIMVGTGAFCSRARSGAYRVGSKCRKPKENQYSPAPHQFIQLQAGRVASFGVSDSPLVVYA